MVDETHELEGDESFAELFEQSLREKPRAIQPGEKVTGRVVQVGAQRVLLDLGGGVDGMIELSELAGPNEPVPVKPGDRLEAYVVRIQNRVAELAKSLGKGVAAKAALEEAAHTGVPVEGTITAVNKGGYVVEVAGERCFCPLGQMDIYRIDDPATLIGSKRTFRIAEWRSGKDIVLSRRALLEEERAERAAKTRDRLEVGARFAGTIVRVMDFGAFVDIGGIEGLVHAGELSYGRQRPQDVVHVGQQVEVEVLRIEAGKDGKERISLSMRALAEDPFDATVDELPEGTIVEGKVMRLQPFGAFVEIVPGVEGLLHVSAFGKRVAHPSDVVSEGQTIAVRIDAVDRAARRISLSYVDPSELEELQQESPAVEEKAAPAKAPAAKAPVAGPGLAVRRAPAAAAAEEKPAAPARTAKAAAPGARVLGHGAPKAVSSEAAEAPAPAAPAGPPAVGTILDVTVDKIETFGVFVSWSSGRGLVPASELGVPRGADLRRSHPVGATFRAVVMDVRPDGKVRLSKTGAEVAEERADAAAWMQGQPRAGGKGLGTLADLLKGKLGK
ncbi:S1 RNA-binding domain-containing protein [Vulgatibacter incomptus]|uniref:SSU ribosomal protein S1p n=1 Tax=Vulgatibacter incomptus TaxID=1391653 RepID=A0A0K1PD13_9BACT|nr:S1 RNA-binding domain-containing protein [Vulgatibacter incomptus]AKU91410.1 SSU ribosomal protein S1p [Vulgatibacter incomptus]